MNSGESNDENLYRPTQCIACKQEIPKGASLCSYCNSYQKSYKNWLRYFAGLAGVATLMVAFGSFALWGISLIPKVFSRERIEVISLNSFGSAVIANLGDEELFLSHIIMARKEGTPWVTKRIELENILKSKEFLRKKIDPPYNGSVSYIREVDIDEKQWEESVDAAHSGKACYHSVFFHKDDALYLELLSITRNSVRTFSATAALVYYNPRTPGLKQKNLPIVGIIAVEDREGCAK